MPEIRADNQSIYKIIQEKERGKGMFSYDDYKEIIRIIKSTKRQANYKDALYRDNFIIMRHDVEYSVERAYALAKVESSMDFSSTFFFQWTNNSYNLLSRKNRDLICDMHERGQNIGASFCFERHDGYAGSKETDCERDAYAQ